MSVTPQLTYPGVYVVEVPSGVRTITGVATSITAFVGRALRGPENDPEKGRIQSFAEYERIFGGLWLESSMSFAVQQFFLNGGTDAIIIRIQNGAKASSVDLAGAGTLSLEASSSGKWADNLKVTVDHDTKDKDAATPVLFNLTAKEVVDTNVVTIETFRNISPDPASSRFITHVLEQESNLVRVKEGSTVPSVRPDETVDAALSGGDDGNPLVDADYQGNPLNKTSFYALKKADLFNLLCIPPKTLDSDTSSDIPSQTLEKALAYCKERRAMLLVEASAGWKSVSDAVAGMNTLTITRDRNSAMFFPRVKMPNPLRENRLDEFAPCGVVAGIFARTDAQRGVWKAPAGQDATLVGVPELSVKLTDGEHGQLNPLGLNCLRQFPITGRVVWGSRTLAGADRLADEYKYIPVRRLALYLEESLYRGTQWVVFEPNDEPLWAQIRLNVGAFMHSLFRQGAFQGTTPRDAYFVKCDKETTTQADINNGIVNILVGFAPLKPAEFVVIKISQIAGQIET